MYDNTALKILEQVSLTPGIHKRALSQQLHVGMPSIDYGLKKIIDLLKEKRFGNQINYFVDYSKESLTPLLVAVEYARFERLPAKIRFAIGDLLSELGEKPLLAILFGSYADGSFTKDSDVDLLLVFQEVGRSRLVENAARRISMRTNTQLSIVSLSYEEFRRSFHDPTKAFFKKLKKDRILLQGVEWWRQLLHEEA